MPTPADYDLTPKAAAELAGVHHETLKRWAAEGRVGAWRTPGGWWRFRRADLEALLEPAPAPEEQAR